MKKLNYTLLGEGIAEYAFIPAYLNKLTEEKGITAVRSRLEIPSSKQPSYSKVLSNIQEFCTQSLVLKGEHLFIAGIDLDQVDFSDDQNAFNSRKQELMNRLGTTLYQRYKNKIILFVPVQCIDHWLLYQYHKISNEKRPAPNSLESRNKKDIQKFLYGDQINRNKIETIISKIISCCDFKDLAKQSRSFKDFHQQLTAFLTNI